MRLLRFVARIPWILAFIGYYVLELVKSNMRVAREVATPGFQATPAILRFHSRCETRWERLHLANAITMTPGTITIEVDPEDGDLYVHTLYHTDRAEFQADVARLEHFLLKAMR